MSSPPSTTLCEVCEARPAVARCRICGRWVCSEHIGVDGVCAVCHDLMCQVCGRRLAVDACVVCGRLVCRTDSVELQPGIRVCKLCWPRLDSIIEKNPEFSYLRRYLRGRRAGLGTSLGQRR